MDLCCFLESEKLLVLLLDEDDNNCLLRLFNLSDLLVPLLSDADADDERPLLCSRSECTELLDEDRSELLDDELYLLAFFLECFLTDDTRRFERLFLLLFSDAELSELSVSDEYDEFECFLVFLGRGLFIISNKSCFHFPDTEDDWLSLSWRYIFSKQSCLHLPTSCITSLPFLSLMIS